MDKNVTDKGWACMRQLLDREMPVESRRRRFGWWWFGLLLLPLAGYGSWRWAASDAATRVPLEAASLQPVASTTPIPQETAAPVSAVAGQAKEESAKTATTQKIAGTSAKKAPSGWATGEKAKSANTVLSPAISEKSVDTEQPTEIHARVSSPPEQAISPEKVVLHNLANPLQTIDFQNNKQYSPRTYASIPPTPSVKKRAGAWAFGASTILSTEQFNSINGFSTGLNVDWAFARKWGLRSGVYYNIHTPQEKYRPVASVPSRDYTANIDGNVVLVDLAGNEITGFQNPAFYGDSLSSNVFIPVSRLQRLEVPVLVFYQIARPLKVFGGLSLSRTLSTRADRQNYSGDYILRLTDQASEDEVSKLSATELERWKANAMLGVGVNIGKMFELGFSANVPFDDFKSLKSTRNYLNAGSLSDEAGRNRLSVAPVLSMYATLFF